MTPETPSPPTTSRSITRTVNGSHRFTISGYSLAKGMGIGRHLSSSLFSVGGHNWAVYFYPDGKNAEDNASYVSVFVVLEGEGVDVRALFEIQLQDQSGKGNHKVHSHFTRSLDGGPYTLKYGGSMWGYKRFFKRATLESSDYLKDDCLIINCTVGVVMSVIDSPRLHSLQVADSDMGLHFGMLLEKQELSDVVFDVAGEKFYAHKLVLAARSPKFREEFTDRLNDDNTVVITDLEPKVFKAMLHFIYTDTLEEDNVLITSLSPVSSVSDTFLAKLLALADKYELARLRLLCESHLCKDISVNSVASTLALAEHHHATELKAACLKFAAENLAGSAEECSSGSKSHSVWGQLADGGDSKRRRVKPRLS